VSYVVLDTDVASAVLRGRVPSVLATRLTGRSLAITFVTVGELTKWTLVRHWGPQRLAGMHTFLSSLVVLPYSNSVAATWGELQAHAQLRGRPRPANDTWIAACCLTRRLPLATLNIKDFSDFVEYDGLQLVAHR
jgi:predicted nucleic acid-binding protein